MPVEGEHIKYEKQVLESLRRSDQAPGSWVGQVYFNTGLFYIGEGFLQKRRPPLLFGGGTDLVQFLAALANLHQDDLKEGMTSSYSSYRPGAIHPILHIVLAQNS